MHEPHLAGIVFSVFLLLLCATFVYLFVKKFSVPYTVMLVVAGMALHAAAKKFTGFSLLTTIRPEPELIFIVLLPTLIFESTLNMNARALYKQLGPSLLLATFGLLFSTFFIGGTLYALFKNMFPLPFIYFLLFGALISATDPVAVSAIFREIGAPLKLNMIVEGESLFNDATAIVLFKTILKIIALGAASMSAGDMILNGTLQFFTVFAGGLFVGCAIGFVFCHIISHLEEEPLIEITLTLIAAYLSFIIADHTLHLSGVMSTLGAGLVLGSYGHSKFSAGTLAPLENFWEIMAHIANSILFLLIGMSVSPSDFSRFAVPLLVAVPVCFLARLLTLYVTPPFIPLPGKKSGIDSSYRWVLIWGGLRGGIAIGLALTLESEGIPGEAAELLKTMTLGVVLSTLLLQATTIKKMVQWFGLDRFDKTDDLSYREGMEFIQRELEKKSKQREEQNLPLPVFSKEQKLETQDGHALSETEQNRSLMLQCLSYEKILFTQMHYHGEISETVMKDLTHLVDVQTDMVKQHKSISEMKTKHVEPYRWMFHMLLQFLSVFFRHSARLNRVKEKEKIRNYEEEHAQILACRAVLKFLGDLRQKAHITESTVHGAENTYAHWLSVREEKMRQHKEKEPAAARKAEHLIGQRIATLLQLEKARELHEKGVLTKKAFMTMEKSLLKTLMELKKNPRQLQVLPQKSED